MAKNLKLNIKNTQLAKAIKLDNIKDKIAGKKSTQKGNKDASTKNTPSKKGEEKKVDTPEETGAEEQPRVKARSKSAFSLTHDESIQKEKHKKETIKKDQEEPISKTDEEVEEEIHQDKNVKLGPTGKHIKDILPAKKKRKQISKKPEHVVEKKEENKEQEKKIEIQEPKKATSQKEVKAKGIGHDDSDESVSKKGKGPKVKVFRDLKPTRKGGQMRSFDARDKKGLRVGEDDNIWRKKKKHQAKTKEEIVTIRPNSLKIRVPITIKELASEMKLKASQLISKLFMQGVIVTLNDTLEDETTIQLLGQDFDCEITIDTSEEERIRITDQTIKEEISSSDPAELTPRSPVITFMGHVDHGKTSLIDYMRKSNITSGEAGAITQHMGAFQVHTKTGELTILDTPGHEAFSAMRARGADVTDIVVLVIAGDEGMRDQTMEAINHARNANVSIVVAINKCDKPNFNVENVYRQLADIELLPEAWGGQTITVNCSAQTGEGIDTLLEMLALQSEVLELKANANKRARGTVLESEMHKGLGSVATVLVQNGTLHNGDAVVFDDIWGRIKTMKDELRKDMTDAGPSTPVEVTGLSGLPEAGTEFIVVNNEKEARDIAEKRSLGKRTLGQQKKAITIESMVQQAKVAEKKVLKVILRADVQGSLEALKVALEKIHSEKAELDIISTGVGEITESDVELANSSDAVIIGFHTQVESHAESLVKLHNVKIKTHDIIYHAIDDVKLLMKGLLDKLVKETDMGKAEVKATFKSSQHGIISGCQVIEGTINRNHHVRLIRNDEEIWKGKISSIRRVKDDVKEVQKGVECGILLSGFSNTQEGDIIESYEVSYIEQEL